MLLQCAKLHMSVLDPSASGTRELKSIARVNIQNQMYFDDLSMVDMFRVGEYSRYLFLEFVKELSCVVVANQGCYDLHVFRLVNVAHSTESRLQLRREYVFKCSRDLNERILGVSVQTETQPQVKARIYIVTSQAQYHVLEVAKREVVQRSSKRKGKPFYNPINLVY